MTLISEARESNSAIAELLGPLKLTLQLFARYWPQLVLLAALGSLARDVLLYLAVEIGLQNALAGMVVLSFVVLAKLVVIVMMFAVLRPGLPAIRAARSERHETRDGSFAGREDGTSAVVAIAILPFFAYYAAWGFLGDTVREYSRLALGKVPFGESANFLDLLQSRWLIASIVVCWLIRWLVKKAKARSTARIWPLLIVACDATWIFIGLYALSTWQDELLRWIGSGDLFHAMPNLEGLEASLSIHAWAAAGFVPMELQPDGLSETVRRLFFYALLPLVWFVMAAIIYGCDLSPAKSGRSRAGPSGERPGWRRWLADFVSHFIAGYRDRYAPVFNSVRAALTAGAATLVALVVGYQFIGWMGAWIWVGLTRLIGAHDLGDWQLIAAPISFLFGSISDQNGGVLLDPLRICLLAAALETAIAAQRAR